MKSLLRTGESGVLLTLMWIGAVALWIGVPLAWLYIGSKVQQATHSVGAALGLMLLGAVVTIGAVVPLLARVNQAYDHLRELRGLDSHGQAPLEAVLVVTAVIAVVLFAIWFALNSGAPLPVPDGEG